MDFLSQNSEEFYNRLPCGYHSLDENGSFVRINNTELQILGYSREEVIGHHLSEFITPESLAIFQDNFPLFKQRGWVNDLEFEMIRKDGTILPVAVSATAIRDEAGNFLRSHSILIDISDRKKLQTERQAAQAALQESEEYFRVLFNLPGVGMAETDIITRRFLRINRAFCQIVGYTEAELLSLTVDELNYPDDRDLDRERYLKLLKGTATSYQSEKRYLRQDGTTIWVVATGNIIRDARGNPVRSFAVIQNISDYKQAEAALVKNEQLLRLSLIGAKAGSWNWELATGKLSWSAETYALQGYDPTNEVPEYEDWYNNRLHQDDRIWVNNSVKQVLEQNLSEFRLEFRILHPQKGIRWLLSLGELMLDEQGKPIYLSGINLDITEQKQAEKALKESETKYRSLFDSIDECFCIIEMIFDENNQPIDYLFLEVNSSFEQQTGIIEAQGKRARELVSNLEEHWFETYGKVALTGEPIRFENVAAEIHRWFDVYAFRLDGTENRVAILFKDISDRKRREANFALLADINEICSRLSSAEKIVQAVGAKIGEYLKVVACNLCEIDEVRDRIVYCGCWQAAEEPPLPSQLCLSEQVSEEFCRRARAKETIVSYNTQIDPVTHAEANASIGVLSFIAVPWHDNGNWKYLFSVHDNVARTWRDDEIELVQELANCLLPRLERAFAEAALAADLQDTQRLHDLSTRLTTQTDIQVLYEEILATAIALMHSNLGSLQIVERSSNQLYLQAYQGFHPDAAAFWQKVSLGDGSTCGQALEQGQRVIVSDLESCDWIRDRETLDYFRLGGIRAVQSSPLIARSGQLIGMFSTHWRQPYQPSDRELRFLDLLARQAADLIEQRRTELAIRQQIEREHLLTEITQIIHQSFDVAQVSQATVDRVREFLQTDRVTIFRFNPDWSGKAVSESVVSKFTSLLDLDINDPCFTEKYIEPYRQGRVSWVSDFPSSDLEPCYKELMAQFQVKANLVVPILQQQNLWGLLIAHHCRTPREWLPEEIELLKQLATQLGIALQQAEFYQNNAQQAALIDIATDAIFVRDLSNRILFWSQGAERLYGWKQEEVRGRIANELFYRESLSQLQQALNTTIESGSWQGELKQLTKSGREIIVLSRWTLMPDGRENPQSVLVVNTDITEKKQLEQQLLHAQRLESIGTLAGGIAHDLNNILTPILSLTQLLPLYNPNLNESSARLLEIVQTNALRGADIVKQILLFSRDLESEWKLVDFPKVLEEVVKLIRETFPKSIVIETDVSPNLGQMEGDSTQLHQLLMNLCVNARDAMPDGGKLIISAKNLAVDRQYSRTNSGIKTGNYIEIAITDTGMGIPPEIIERIFDPFFTTKEPGKGTGLGLSTAIGIVKNHGGKIEVKSDRRSDTQFRVYFPATEASATTETITAEIPFGRGELILVVDDEAEIREVTKATLEAYNYRVITASDGLDAIAVYAQQRQEIEIVLMDLSMPEMDGLTAMPGLKKIHPNVKLIATSGMATKEKISAAKSLGIKSCLLKPYTTEKLLLSLNKAIANSIP